MRKYELVLTPAEVSGNTYYANRTNEKQENLAFAFELEEHPNVILLTMEELEKMLYFFFKEGESLGAEAERKDAFAKLQSTDFKATLFTYLKSKGITI